MTSWVCAIIIPFKTLNKVACVYKKSSLSHQAHILHWPYICRCQINPASTPYQPAPNMPRDDAELKARVKKAAQVVKDHTLKLPLIMIFILFDKNLENQYLIVGGGNKLTNGLERMSAKEQINQLLYEFFL